MAKATRSELREKIMTILYQINVYQQHKIAYDIDEVINGILEVDNEFVKDAVYGVMTNLDYIDSLANKYLNNWTIDRLGFTDQAIIRLSIYELMYTNTPDVIFISLKYLEYL